MDPYTTQDDVHSCAICQTVPENIVMLECNHNLCLSCALKLYQSQKKQKIISCSLCQRFSQLDEMTISELNNQLTQLDQNYNLIGQKDKAPSRLARRDYKYDQLLSGNDQDLSHQRSLSPYTSSLLGQEKGGYSKMPMNYPQNPGKTPPAELALPLNTYSQRFQKPLSTVLPLRPSNALPENFVAQKSQKTPSKHHNAKKNQDENFNEMMGQIDHLRQYPFQPLKDDKMDISEISSIPPQGRNTLVNTRCKEHPEFELLYFCFGCSGQCICPECAIHGIHKNHNVQGIRKAQQIMKDKVIAVLNDNQVNIQNFSQQISQMQNLKKLHGEEAEKIKSQITRQFSELKIVLEQQEHQLISQCEELKNYNIGQFDNLSEKLQSHKRKLETINQQQQQNIGGMNDIAFLTHYADNLEKIRGVSSNLYSVSLGELDIQKNLLNSDTLVALIKPIVTGIQALAVPSQQGTQPNAIIDVQQPIAARQQSHSDLSQVTHSPKPKRHLKMMDLPTVQKVGVDGIEADSYD